MAAEHHALQLRIGLGHRAELEPEVEARPLPRQEAELAAIDLARQRFGLLARRDRDHRVGVNVVDMRVRNKSISGVSIDVARGLRLNVQ